MAHKKKHAARVPQENRLKVGPAATEGLSEKTAPKKGTGAGFQEQDPKRRLGDFETAGEHSIQQPGGKNDANH